jgi:hypothetical protein
MFVDVGLITTDFDRSLTLFGPLRTTAGRQGISVNALMPTAAYHRTDLDGARPTACRARSTRVPPTGPVKDPRAVDKRQQSLRADRRRPAVSAR